MSAPPRISKSVPRIIEKRLDASAVSNAALRSLGLPAPPDANKQPVSYATWHRFFGGPVWLVDPKPIPNYSVLHGPLMRGPLPLIPPIFPEFDPTSSTWSGAAVTNQAAVANANGVQLLLTEVADEAGAPAQPLITQISSVQACWTVPNIYPPASSWDEQAGAWADGIWISGNWIGIDGWQERNICQAGTAHMVTANGGDLSWEYWAFYEWYSEGFNSPEHVISGFPIMAGDVISAWVSVDTDTGLQGTFTLRKTGTPTTPAIVTSMPIVAPAGAAPLACDTAEWIVELPGAPDGTYALPNYGVTWFYNMLVNYGNDQWGDVLLQDLAALWLSPQIPAKNVPVPTPATVIDMANGGKVLSQAVGVTTNTLGVSFTGDSVQYVPSSDSPT
jgi:hypothetical protein